MIFFGGKEKFDAGNRRCYWREILSFQRNNNKGGMNAIRINRTEVKYLMLIEISDANKEELNNM